MNTGASREAKLNQRLAQLRTHFLLRDLAPADLERLAAMAVVMRCRAGEVMFREGDAESDLVILLGGKFKLSSLSPDGREIIVDILTAGQMFGEIAVLDGQPRLHDAIAMEESEVLLLRRRDLIPFLAERPEACLRFMSGLCARLRRAEAKTQEAVFLGVATRLAKQILRLGGANGGEGTAPTPLKLSQGELAALLGLSRESVNKQLAQWKRKGIVDYRRRELRVLDRKRLEDIAAA